MCASREFPILRWSPPARHTGEMPSSARRPGDHILDQYATQLDSEARELARDRLRDLARVLIRIDKRLAAEDVPMSDSTQSGSAGTIPSLPTS